MLGLLFDLIIRNEVLIGGRERSSLGKAQPDTVSTVTGFLIYFMTRFTFADSNSDFGQSRSSGLGLSH